MSRNIDIGMLYAVCCMYKLKLSAATFTFMHMFYACTSMYVCMHACMYAYNSDSMIAIAYTHRLACYY